MQHASIAVLYFYGSILQWLYTAFCNCLPRICWFNFGFLRFYWSRILTLRYMYLTRDITHLFCSSANLDRPCAHLYVLSIEVKSQVDKPRVMLDTCLSGYLLVSRLELLVIGLFTAPGTIIIVMEGSVSHLEGIRASFLLSHLAPFTTTFL